VRRDVSDSAVGVDTVSSSSDLREFVELAYRIYAGDPSWPPPLRSDVRWMLDEAKNPFWKHAKRRLFLARRAGKVVGRIAAIVDDEHNRVHGEKTGFFGFFESENDREVAPALFGAAEAAVRSMLPGCDRLRGPANPSLNDEVGALVPAESDPGLPFLMMTYNPAYYLDLFAEAGYAKEKDLVAILAPVGDVSFKRLARLSEAVRRREKGLVVRTIRMDRFNEDLAIVKSIYNAAWEKNWGFVPMTSDEIDAMAKKLKPILHPPYILFVEIDGKAVGFSLALPDFNQVLVKMGGSLFPLGWLKFFTEKRKIDRVRVLALGVLPEYRRRGIDALLYYESAREGIRIGHKWAEFSWMLEDNLEILKPLEVFGGRIYRRYRLVAKRL
jgi:ribosomal protein S18 acetylase RimI-like enzyme